MDDGPTSAGVESTIERVRDGAVEILRPGPVTADMLGAASGLAARGVEGSEVVAPGMLASHYEPGKPVRLGAATFAVHEFGIGLGAVGGECDERASVDVTDVVAAEFGELNQVGASRQKQHGGAGCRKEGKEG